MVGSPFRDKKRKKKRAWTPRGDQVLVDFAKVSGKRKWKNISKETGPKRCEKRRNITHDEEDLIIRLYKLLGNRWSLIAGRLPGRTDNEIKNYWNSTLRKKIQGNRSTQSQSENKPINQTSEESALSSNMDSFV